jgi:hypothetical protein
VSFGYDEELPAGFQEADFEMAELEAAADRRSRCKHVYVEENYLGPGIIDCTDCGKQWHGRDDYLADTGRKLN